MRATVTAGEALPADLQRRFAARFGHPVLDGIGTTEALHIFLSNRKGDERPGTSGTPVPGYDARLVDDAGADVTDADTPGYLQVRGPSIATGYWSRDAATARRVPGRVAAHRRRVHPLRRRLLDVPRPQQRHDQGRRDLGVAGRGRGVLIEHPDVLEAAVVGARDASGLEQTVAFVVPRQGSTIDPDVDRRPLPRADGRVQAAQRIVVVDELPKTATGKIQRFALRDRLRRA